MTAEKSIPHIIIVGGGAGGIELASLLGKKVGKQNKAIITLVDTSPTHIWKPLLHEIAAGTLNSNEDEINYMAYASQHDFHFSLGTLHGLDRAKKEIKLAPILNHGQPSIPERILHYDILIMAVGSVVNDFGIPGVKENCLFLDNQLQAKKFHRTLLNSLMEFSYNKTKENFNIAIVGGGATGIELIAELHSAVRLLANYGLDINPDSVTFSLIEGADTLLPALPSRLSLIVLNELKRLGVHIHLGQQVSEVTNQGLNTKSGQFISSDMTVWTAGIKAPDFLKQLDGLEVNRINQLIVKQTLQTTLDDAIFALGDCASCPQTNSTQPVPPRAQAAHQQALFLMKALNNYLEQKSMPIYHYKDYGSLVSLSSYTVVGNLMGKITQSFMVEGKLARLFYLSLYKQHQAALYGYWRVALLSLANLLSSKIRPRMKLH